MAAPIESPKAAVELPVGVIDRLCDEFDSEWSGEGPAAMNRFLGQVDEASRRTLLRNLLQVEFRRLRHQGREPERKRYIEQWPQYSDVVDDELFASTVIQATAIEETKTAGRPTLRESLLKVTRLGDYVIEHELGRGGMGVVFCARHVRHGERVALKTLPAVDGPQLDRFKREFRTLADVSHPNLIGLHRLEMDGGQWFFTMDLVDGEDFLSYVRPNGVLDENRLREALAQLTHGVQVLHERGILHRDLKPSNVLVSAEGQVQLLDFGVVLDLKHQGSAGEFDIAGTPAYMAPELFSGQVPGEASDWYAVGVMLFQALTGSLPFSGTLTELIHDKKTLDPPSLSSDVPTELSSLCRRLLSRNPGARPQAADILQIVQPSDDSRPALLTPLVEHFCGREEERRAFENEINIYCNQTGPAVVFVSGQSGEGKTLLVERCVEPMRKDPGWIVLSGRCYDRESVPFKAVDGLVDALGERLRSLPDEHVQTLLVPEVAVLAELFPVLNRVATIDRLPRVRLDLLEPERVRELASQALRELFRRLSQQAKLVCVVDDLQWGDGDSAELLLGVLSSADAPHLLLVGTYRSDEADGSPFLQVWNRQRESDETPLSQLEIRLECLSENDCIDLVVAIVGRDDDLVQRRAREMAQETGGNPFLLCELASCFDPDAPAERPTQIDGIVERKLLQLPPAARVLLEIVSVSGQALTIEEAAHTAGQAAVPMSTMMRMRVARLVRMVGDEGNLKVDTYHDRIRETVLREMPSSERKTWHVKLAEEILAAGKRQEGDLDGASAKDSATRSRVFDLAYHFYEGEDPRAFGCQLDAGDAAMRAFATADAIEYFSRAKRLLPSDAASDVKHRVHERLGTAYSKAGEFAKARELFEIALPLATTDIEAALAHDGLGLALQRSGDIDSALKSYDRALRKLGFRRPKWMPLVLLEASWLMAQCSFPWLIRTFRSPADRQRARMAAEVLHHFATVYLLTDVIHYIESSARLTKIALRSGDPVQIVTGFAKLSYNNAVGSMKLAADWYLKLARQYRRKSDDDFAQTSMDVFQCYNLYLYGQLDDAEKLIIDVLPKMAREGESFHRMCLIHTLRHLYGVRGHSEQELEQAEIERRVGESISEPDTIAWAHYGFADAYARMGRLKEARQHMSTSLAAIEGLDRPLSRSIAFNHAGFVYLQSSDYGQAFNLLEESRRVLESEFMYFEYQVGTYSRIIESALGPDWTGPIPTSNVKRARRFAIKARFFGWRFPTLRPHAQRALGRLMWAIGRKRKARAHFENSIASARSIGAEYDLARSLLDLSSIDDKRHEELRADAVSILRRIKGVVPYAERWQLGVDLDSDCFAPQI